MKREHFVGILILFTVFSGLIACQKTPPLSIEELREQELQKRLTTFIENETEACYTNTLELAIQKADSLLKLNAIRYKIDDLERPPLPEKPDFNPRPAPQDTIRNVPFLKTKIPAEDKEEESILQEESM